MPPKISVIIPAYNPDASHLEQSINSVLGQSFTDFELIVVDDGSTQNTAQVAQSFGDSLRYLPKTNGGLSSARNAGIDAASGEYIAFLDQDDLFLPHRLEVQAPLLDEDPELGLVYGQAIVFRDDSPREHLLPDPGTFLSGRIFQDLYFKNAIPVLTVLARRTALQAAGNFDESLRAGEDWECWLRVCSRFPVAFVPEPVARYRRHESNMSGDLTLMLEAEVECLKACRVKNPASVRAFQGKADRFLARKQIRLARHLQKAGRNREAHQNYSEAHRLGYRTPKSLLNWLRTRSGS